MKLAMLSLVACGLAGISQAKAEVETKHLSVQQGDRLVLDAVYALHDDCSPGPLPQFKSKEMPINGQLLAGRTRSAIKDDKKCPGIVAPILAVNYIPNANFVDFENVQAVIVMQNGKERQMKWIINVDPRVKQGQLSQPALPVSRQ